MDRTANLKPFVVALLAFLALGESVAPADAKIVKATMFSPANGRNVEYRVYTPPGYNAKLATRYPVVFSLHGEGGIPSQRANNYAPTLDLKITSGEIMPMIWVFPDGQNNSYYGNSFDGDQDVYSHIIDELVPKIDSTFKTIANRSGRAVEGFSMGGFGAGLYAATDPELFSATLMSGSALPTWAKLLGKEPDVSLGMYNNVEANWRPYSLWDQTAANAAAIAASVNYKLVCGDHDGQLANNKIFRDYLLSLGIDPKFEVLTNVGHGGTMYIKEGTGLRFLNDHFLRARQSPAVAGFVPEPSAVIIASCASLAMLRRRRR